MAENADVSRRRFLQTAAGGTVVAAATGTAAAQEGNTTSGNATAANGTAGNQTAGNATAGNETSGNETSGGGESGGGGSAPAGPPDFGGYLDGANNYSGNVVDKTGQKEVTVQVGAGSTNLAFGPAAVHVDNGATVKWEWTGKGGAHNVVSNDDVFNSGSPTGSAGVNYEYTFKKDGVYNYHCKPHEASGMKAAIVVGTDYPAKQPKGKKSGGVAGIPDGAKSIGIATSLVMSATLGLVYFFMKYGGDYETPG
ncbi:MAG: halocyanin domain-containing protein [Halorientalis sp.]